MKAVSVLLLALPLLLTACPGKKEEPPPTPAQAEVMPPTEGAVPADAAHGEADAGHTEGSGTPGH